MDYVKASVLGIMSDCNPGGYNSVHCDCFDNTIHNFPRLYVYVRRWLYVCVNMLYACVFVRVYISTWKRTNIYCFLIEDSWNPTLAFTVRGFMEGKVQPNYLGWLIYIFMTDFYFYFFFIKKSCLCMLNPKWTKHPLIFCQFYIKCCFM